MIARNCTKENLIEALRLINETEDFDRFGGPDGNFKGNICFKRFDAQGRGFIFTLTVKDSRGLGARRSHKGRRIAAACWHAHGRFFEALFRVAPDARVFSSFYRRAGNGWITREHGNWIDGEIGSAYQPMNMSEACDC